MNLPNQLKRFENCKDCAVGLLVYTRQHLVRKQYKKQYLVSKQKEVSKQKFAIYFWNSASCRRRICWSWAIFY